MQVINRLKLRAKFNETLDPESVVADQEAFYRDNLHRVPPNQPVVDFAKRVAQSCPVAVASGGVWETVTKTLDAIGLRELFQAIVATRSPLKRPSFASAELSCRARSEIPFQVIFVFVPSVSTETISVSPW